MRRSRNKVEGRDGEPDALDRSSLADAPIVGLPYSQRSELKRLELRSRRAISSEYLGNYRSAFRGTGLIFSDLRQYQPGDDLKHIHWKVTARSGKPFVKWYEEDRALRLLLAVDMSASTTAGLNRRTKHKKALEFAALIGSLAYQSRDALGLCTFDDQVSTYRAPKRRLSQRQLLASLSEEPPSGTATDLRAPLAEIRSREKRHAVVFVLSDFFCPPFEHELTSLSFRHDVICVLLEDELDYSLPNIPLVEFTDPESGERLVVDGRNQAVRTELRRRHEARRAALLALTRRCGAELITVRDDVVKPLADLMRARVKRIR